jgi:methylglutaconyl-CoA hydratase
MSHYETLHIHTDASLHTILLNRPEKRNALTPQLMSELTHALEAAANNPHARVVLLTGAGSAFCAGLDLDALRDMTADSSPEKDRVDTEKIATLFRTLYTLPKPTIAAVNGPAIAGGMGLATLCDFTLAVPEAKFGYTEVRIGFLPAIVSVFLRAQIGEKRCRDLLLTGRVISAVEAHDLGLVTRIVPEPELLQEARTLANRLLRNSPAAMEATKRLISGYSEHFLRDGFEAAIVASVSARSDPDFREGVSAFLEKRDPHWPSQRKDK